MKKTIILNTILLFLISNCSQTNTYKIDYNKIASIKSGTPIAKIKSELSAKSWVIHRHIKTGKLDYWVAYKSENKPSMSFLLLFKKDKNVLRFIRCSNLTFTVNSKKELLNIINNFPEYDILKKYSNLFAINNYNNIKKNPLIKRELAGYSGEPEKLNFRVKSSKNFSISFHCIIKKNNIIINPELIVIVNKPYQYLLYPCSRPGS